jgi:hypothetical protein
MLQLGGRFVPGDVVIPDDPAGLSPTRIDRVYDQPSTTGE